MKHYYSLNKLCIRISNYSSRRQCKSRSTYCNQSVDLCKVQVCDTDIAKSGDEDQLTDPITGFTEYFCRKHPSKI